MTRFVIDSAVALNLAENQAKVDSRHQLIAPTLIRSQVLASLYGQARKGKLTRKDAGHRLEYLRKLKIRLLGDRVVQADAWKVAEKLNWPDTYVAEYIALTLLQADAFVTLDAKLAKKVREIVKVASIRELMVRR